MILYLHDNPDALLVMTGEVGMLRFWEKPLVIIANVYCTENGSQGSPTAVVFE